MAAAALVDKDPYTYQKERDAFLKELWQFHQSRGTAYTKIPKIGGKEVDLYLLYSKINLIGGWEKVNDGDHWEDLLEYFRIPRACTHATLALKDISLRYLYVFHKVRAGDDPDVRQYEESEESARKRKRQPHHHTAMRYNYRQHIVSDTVRANTGLATEVHAGHEYLKLERALLSGLPNEVDFAVNVCTLLSNEGRRTLQLSSCPHMVHLLLAHVGVFEDRPAGTHAGSYQTLYENGWKPYTGRNFLRFWLDSVSDKEIRDLISPSSIRVNQQGEAVDSAQPIDMEVDQEKGEQEEASRALTTQSRQDYSESLYEILNLNRELGLNDVEGQRVMQMAMIIRNLSFDDQNSETLASNLCVLRFLQLCIHSKYASLKQLGLDTLGSICKRIKLDPIDYRTTQLILRTITRCISSPDKFEVTRGLEMLANLSLTVDNVDTLSTNLEQWVYNDIVNMLLVHDIQLIVHTLEALYQLSELGESTANKIAEVRAAIAILVDLTTVEAQSYGPNSLLGIKVVEHVPPPTPQQLAMAPQHPTHHPSPHHGSPHRPLPVTPSPQIARAQAPITVHQLHQQQSTPLLPSTSHHGTTKPTPRILPMVQPTPAQPPPPPVPPHTATPVSNAQLVKPVTQSASHPEMDGESTACNWLQAHIEVSTQAVMTRMELYGEYLAACGRLSIKNAINTNSFANCVRVTFPKVDSTRVEKADGSVEIHYRGLKRRDVALPFPSLSNRLGLPAQQKPQHQPSPAIPAQQNRSSVLQQHLSSPPQAQRSPTSVVPPTVASQNSPTYPTIQHALLQKGDGGQAPESPTSTRPGGAPDSNLIKSLLANKVTANMHRSQQQQQSPTSTPLQHQPPMLVQGQSPYTSQQPMPSQVPNAGQQPQQQLLTNQDQQQSQTPQQQGLPQAQANLSSASLPPKVVIPDGASSTFQQPPSPRSRLKMTLVAKAAAGNNAASTGQSSESSVDQKPAQSNPATVTEPNMDNFASSKSAQGEACIERVQNTYVQKLEEEIVKQNDTDLKDTQSTQGVITASVAEANAHIEEQPTVKTEATTEKSNGLGANGSHHSETESHPNNRKFINGNTTDKQHDQIQLDKKDVSTKSALTESEKLLTPEEIEKRKHEEVAQLLERNKDQVLGLNGVINHVGNGECIIPPFHKGPLTKEIFNPDMTSGLSLNQHQIKLQLQAQQKPTDKKPTIVENGFSPSSQGSNNNHTQEQDSKSYIPGDVGRSVCTAGSTTGTLVNCNSNNSTQNQSQPGCNSKNQIDSVTPKTEIPMEVDTADIKPVVTPATVQSVSGLTIANILTGKQEVQKVEPSMPVLNNPQPGRQPGQLTVAQTGGLPNALPALGYMSQISSLPAATSATTNPQLTTVPSTVNRPSVLPTGVQVHQQLAKVSNTDGNVQSPTLANLPTPGDLASQVKNVMQSQPTAVISAAAGGQTVQASAIMQQLQQPMQQQAQAQTQQQQLVVQQQQGQPQTVVSSSNFAAHMQQLQQRLQMPPQVSWPAGTSQPQTVPISSVATGAPLQTQPQPGIVQAVVAPQQQVQVQQKQQTQPIQPSIKSQLMQRLQQPLAPARPLLQPHGPTGSQSPLIIQQSLQQQAGQQQQQQPIVLQQQSVNGQVHQVVVSASNLVMPTASIQQQAAAQVQLSTTQVQQQQRPAPLQQAMTLVPGQAPGQQPNIQVVSSQQQQGGQQQVQVVSTNTGQPTLQVVSNQQGQPQIQVIQQPGTVQGQPQQIQVVAGQGQQLGTVQVQTGQQVQVMPGGQLQVRQVMPGQCVQMVQGQPQVMQVQLQAGQQIVFQTQQQQGGATTAATSTTPRPIQPAISQQQQQPTPLPTSQQQQQQMILPRPTQQASTTPTPQVIIVSQPTSTVTTTVSQPQQAQQLTVSQSQQPIVTKHAPTTTQQPQLQQQLTKPTAAVEPPKPLHVQTTATAATNKTETVVSPTGVVTTTSSTNKRPSTAPLKCDTKSSKKSRQDSSQASPTVSQPSPTTTTTTPSSKSGDYMCEWAGCKSCFESQKACSTHMVKTHLPAFLDSGFCKWEGCDKLKRQRWSLITHVQDRHLTEQALRTAHVKRQQAAASAAASGSGAGTAAAPPPVYPADAALQAIRRFAPRQPYPEFVQKQQGQGQGGGQQNPPHQTPILRTRPQHPPIPPFEEPKEGPVTKHIRLTSGLILRNIAKYSNKGRQSLLKHERHLAYIALSSVEASTAISHCLWELRNARSSAEEEPTSSTSTT